ncbi:heavy-metal-associated domain-containing protein [Chitinophaga rhizophila]|uniref:Heavy-metal-associated domain-containing protein n=1 Tax=Chitinophaga rhizophila TaxID=2866212 RepID=A0ABS7G6J4_9BACT|nr:heavy-metal-associated domain-containing protein [Chitinophaga rhizophila]MBW8682996.1 heavy-metal-associated domain-containing protein [Chitinophaga rhizophila]
MKKVISLSIALMSVLGASSAFAQSAKKASFKVYGNCGMCKNRVEKALAVEGVKKAEWNVKSKMMTVSYDPAKISSDDIQKKVAAAGHDTDNATASDAVYAKLPGCCLYTRKGQQATGAEPAHQHQH